MILPKSYLQKIILLVLAFVIPRGGNAENELFTGLCKLRNTVGTPNLGDYKLVPGANTKIIFFSFWTLALFFVFETTNFRL